MGQYIVSGLSAGALYAIVAIGIVVVYRASGVINFAHGEMATMSTFIVYAVWKAGASIGVALVVGMCFAAALGVGVDRLVMGHLRNQSHVNEVMVTIALFLMLNGLSFALFGGDQQSFPSLVNGAPVEISDLILTRQSVLILVFTTLTAGSLALFFGKTSMGAAMRAIAENRTAATAIGLPVVWIVCGVWAGASVLGLAAGVLVAPTVLLNVNMMLQLLVKAFAGAVLGGLDSLSGALVGCLILGVAENLVSGYVSPELATPFVFVVIVAVLLIHPQGLLGRTESIKL